MTIQNPVPGNNLTLPAARDVHEKALTLLGLITSMDAQVDRIGAGGTGLFACIDLAMPLARSLADDLEKRMDDAADAKAAPPASSPPPSQSSILPSLDEVNFDAFNLLELISLAEDDMGSMPYDTPLHRSVIRRHGSLLSSCRKLMEILAQNTEALASARHLRVAEIAARAQS